MGGLQMSKLFVKAQNVGRTYLQGVTPIEALISATCSVKPGDRIALIGPSGSGKSTLLHLFGGLDHPTSGNISWPDLGTPETLRPHQISFVFQMPSLLAPLTALENVALPLLMKGSDETEANALALDILEQMGLETILEKLPEELSGGQAQRVAVARALVCHPKLILADEPTGQLDHPTAQRLLDVLLNVLKNSETALVIATHDLAIAERMNHQWQMQHGVLEVN
jgi:ABC-type lipoprotein export system ATPase subunit